MATRDGTVRNWFKEVHPEKPKPSLIFQLKETRLQWAKEKQPWTVDDLMEVIFGDESPICFGEGDDAGTLVWFRCTET